MVRPKHRAFLEDLRLAQSFTFQQESDPKHTYRATLNVLERAARSHSGPDLNLIDYLWQDLKIAGLYST